MDLKTVVIIRNAAAYDFGGGERFPVFLAQGLASKYHPVIISAHKQLLDFAESHSVKTVRGRWWKRQNWNGWRIGLFPAYFAWQLYLAHWYKKQFRKLRPSVVHIQSKDDFIAATIAAKIVGARIIWTDHADLKHVWKNLNIWYKNPIGKWIFRSAQDTDVITVVSESEKLLVTNNLPRLSPVLHKITTVYNGVFDSYDTYAGRPKNKDFTFCSASRLVTDKGIGELLQAFREVRSEYPDSRLVILGDGPERSMFDKNQEGVEFRGHVANPLADIAQCDAFVHPTYHEGFSVALVEASMLARPIIATNVGGNPEIIQHETTGLLVPPKDSTALAAAMKHLVQDAPLRQRLGHSAREQYKAKFSFDKIIEDKFIPLYEKNNH